MQRPLKRLLLKKPKENFRKKQPLKLRERDKRKRLQQLLSRLKKSVSKRKKRRRLGWRLLNKRELERKRRRNRPKRTLKKPLQD